MIAALVWLAVAGLLAAPVGFFGCCCVTGPPPPCDSPIHTCFHILWCSASRAGATVSLTDGTHNYTGTTDASGNVCFEVAYAGTYNWTVSKTGLITSSGSVVLTCGVTPSTINVTLALVSGYYCGPRSCEPVSCQTGPPYAAINWPTSVTVTDPQGSFTLTGGGPDNPLWTGWVNRLAANAYDCASLTPTTHASVPMFFNLACGGGTGFEMSASFTNCPNGLGGCVYGAPGPFQLPGTGAYDPTCGFLPRGGGTVLSVTKTACGTSFMFTQTSGFSNTIISDTYALYQVYGASATFVVSS